MPVSKVRAIEILWEHQQQINDLRQGPIHSQEFEEWRRDTSVSIGYLFPDKPQYGKDFLDISYSLMAASTRTPNSAWQQAYLSGLQSAEALLKSMIREIERYWPDSTASTTAKPAANPVVSQEVFIIHGHDDWLKEATARLIASVGLNPVILHEQANRGRTIIEKFVDHAHVAFAIALFTPDDVGASKDKADSPNPRARQNVIFELGYFAGKLGRDRVVALIRDRVERPSDWDGVLYIPVDDSGAWKFKLGQELQDVGLVIDLSKIRL